MFLAEWAPAGASSARVAIIFSSTKWRQWHCKPSRPNTEARCTECSGAGLSLGSCKQRGWQPGQQSERSLSHCRGAGWHVRRTAWAAGCGMRHPGAVHLSSCCSSRMPPGAPSEHALGSSCSYASQHAWCSVNASFLPLIPNAANGFHPQLDVHAPCSQLLCTLVNRWVSGGK